MPILMEFVIAIILLIEFVIFFPMASYYRVKGRELPQSDPPKVNKGLSIYMQVANLVFMFILWLSVPIFLMFDVYYPFFDWTTFNIFIPECDKTWFQVIGIMIFSIGILLVSLARLVIKEWHAFPWEPHKLGEGFVNTGIYSKVRHPIYGATLILFPGYVITFQSWLAIICFIPFLALINFAFEEEKWLLERFGKKYEDYMKKTWRFFPKLW